MVAKYSLSTHLDFLRKYIKSLEKYKKMINKKKFLSDEMIQDVIERNLQLVIECMLTIGEIIIARYNFRKPETNDDIFDVLAEGKVYPKKFAEDLWGLGGFRNILVHNYINLDLEKVYSHLEKGIPIFKKYAQYIARYVARF